MHIQDDLNFRILYTVNISSRHIASKTLSVWKYR